MMDSKQWILSVFLVTPMMTAGHSADEAAMALVAKHRSIWPSGILKNGYVSKTASSGVIQGNGDFKAISGSDVNSITFHLLKNDFWRLQTGSGNTSPKVGGRLRIASPQMEDAAFSASPHETILLEQRVPQAHGQGR